jgi:hypothetical protein
MTSGASMMSVGVYLMLFANIQEIKWLNIVGAVLATAGFIWSAHYEDEIKYRLARLEKRR